MALRYFKEQMPDLHVIGAGLLLEFTLNDDDFKVPVGRVEFLYLQALSLTEFLEAMGFTLLKEQLKNITLENPLSEAVHQHYLKLVRDYTILGGMPGIIKNYLLTGNFIR